jgi:hypothetical protein
VGVKAKVASPAQATTPLVKWWGVRLAIIKRASKESTVEGGY